MVKKYFYETFNLLYEGVADSLNIYQKEELYRLIFATSYEAVDFGYMYNDMVRKITSGNLPVHRKVAKRIYTIEGFEELRKSIEDNLYEKIKDKKDLFETLKKTIEKKDFVPVAYKNRIMRASYDDSYEASRLVASILVCNDYLDYACEKGKKDFLDVRFMRMDEDAPPLRYPKYITEVPTAISESIIGRDDDIKTLDKLLLKEKKNLIVSGVGGLGKTELVKLFLKQLCETEVQECEIDAVAWVHYNNEDLRFSLKQALHLQCELDEVWMKVQALSDRYGKRLLIVIDNIEKSDDEYLEKLGSLSSLILVTSRRRDLKGISNTLLLEPLSIEYCRELFYTYYEFDERDNEILNDVIELSAKLTIVIVMLAKVASLEELGLRELYNRLKDKGFKLSEEDISVEHERLTEDATIITQVCILFSLLNIGEREQALLTYISLIPNLKFDFVKAKRWFGIKKNSDLMKLFKMGLLEEVTIDKKHIYWMHSVIAASVREQQKNNLYNLSRTFVDILTEELDYERISGKEYEKTYLIPFSWSVADIMENHWADERDVNFLMNLFHVCFACSHYRLCAKLIDLVISIQSKGQEFDYNDLAYSYRNKVDLFLQFDMAGQAENLMQEIETLFDENDASPAERDILKYQYAILYQVKGEYKKSREYFQQCIDESESSDFEYSDRDKSTAYANMGRMLIDSGAFSEAYDYLKKAIELHGDNEEDADLMICYSSLASVCTELMHSGFGTTYVEEAVSCFEKVVKFREKNLGKHHADTAVVYHDYAFFWYVLGVYDKAYKYNEKAYAIEYELFAEHSITRLRSLNTKALIFFETNKQERALDIFEEIIQTAEAMSSDYVVDLADFQFNYAICLAEMEYYDEAKRMYEKCISIWAGLTDDDFRKLAEAYLGYANILIQEGNVQGAKENYKLAEKHILEDFYLMVDVMDNIALCSMVNDDIEEATDKFVELLNILLEYKAYDSETKFQLCNNLANVIKGEDEVEKEVKESILEKIHGEQALMEYVDEYFSKIKENLVQETEQTYQCLSNII